MLIKTLRSRSFKLSLEWIETSGSLDFLDPKPFWHLIFLKRKTDTSDLTLMKMS